MSQFFIDNFPLSNKYYIYIFDENILKIIYEITI